MQQGTVTGAIWSTRRIGKIPGGALLDVELDHGEGHLVAFDVLGTGVGERVIVVRGSVAADWFDEEARPPIDALVIGAIDEPAGTTRPRSRRRSSDES